MSVLDPRELEASPLADLHALAAELGLEGYRRLRKEELITQLVASTGPDPETQVWEDAAPEPEGFEAPEEPDVAPLVELVEDEPEPEAAAGALEPEEDEEPAEEEEPGVDEEEPAEEDIRTGILDV